MLFRSQAETAESRANRLRSAADVLQRGVEPFIETMVPRLVSKTTLDNRPDRVAEIRRMMLKMSPQDIDQVQHGIAERPDSVPTLKTINVPTLILVGSDDVVSPIGDAEVMRGNIPHAELRVVERGGHYAVYEQPEECGRMVRQFLDRVHSG